AIHQEPVFKASRKRVYEALTDAKQFEKVVQLSAAMKSGMAPGAKSAEISREAGGAFSLFGGYVTGRQLELVPNERIVQAWPAGAYFQLLSVSSTAFTSNGWPPMILVILIWPSGAITTWTFTTPVTRNLLAVSG